MTLPLTRLAAAAELKGRLISVGGGELEGFCSVPEALVSLAELSDAVSV